MEHCITQSLLFLSTLGLPCLSDREGQYVGLAIVANTLTRIVSLLQNTSDRRSKSAQLRGIIYL
jgi:hypothetical protein